MNLSCEVRSWRSWPTRWNYQRCWFGMWDFMNLHWWIRKEAIHWDAGSKLWEANNLHIEGSTVKNGDAQSQRVGQFWHPRQDDMFLWRPLKAFTFEPEPDMIVSWNPRVLESIFANRWIQGRSPKSLKYDWMLGDQLETKCNKARHFFKGAPIILQFGGVFLKMVLDSLWVKR